MSIKLALLLSANPRDVKEGPVVYVPKGKWRVLYELVDTIFSIPTLDDLNYVIEGPKEVRVVIEKAGTEKHITIWLEKHELIHRPT